MSISLAIQVGNKEYNVVGENENLIREAAKILNDEISALTAKNINNDSIPLLTKTTLAALNIAESELKLVGTWNDTNKEIANEIYRIVNFIEININNPHFE